MNPLIEKLRLVVHDPDLATDEGHAITNGRGEKIIFVARPCATLDEILAAEAKLGFTLPPLLRSLYIEVGNGGFGPGYGLWGVESARPVTKTTVVSEYVERRRSDPEFPEWHWPEGLLPICDWGCGISSCVDCLQEDAPIYRYDPESDLPDHVGIEPENKTFAAWIAAWLNDEDL